MRVVETSLLLNFALRLPAIAKDVNITPDMASRTFALNGHQTSIGRIQDNENRQSPEATKTSGECSQFAPEIISQPRSHAALVSLWANDFAFII